LISWKAIAGYLKDGELQISLLQEAAANVPIYEKKQNDFNV
jgi:hypothetical protein